MYLTKDIIEKLLPCESGMEWFKNKISNNGIYLNDLICKLIEDKEYRYAIWLAARLDQTDPEVSAAKEAAAKAYAEECDADAARAWEDQK